MTTQIRPDRPLPAPLPYTSQAARSEIIPPKPVEVRPVDPDAPVLREDEATEVACTLFVVIFIGVMVIVAAFGGL
ncbi:hypothetical protein [Dietzia alimentaria]|uniref:hypothetical protein n=1 Tax=Dietzia alimentaria TaxID=665550 RepID=UPI0011456A75|nr:hypothetical protein [Dietzia alimentaria]